MKGPELSPEEREALRKRLDRPPDWSTRDPRIVALHVRNEHTKWETLRVAVGEALDSRLGGTIGEYVLAILESRAYLVITPNRGYLRGDPYLYGADQVVAVEYESGERSGPRTIT